MSITKTVNEYEITVVGNQNGAPIPVNHRYVIVDGSVSGNEADDGYDLWMDIRTYEDSNHDTLLHNDLLPNNNLTLDLGATLPTSKIATVVKTNFEAWLDTEPTIGAGNWTKIF